MKINMNEMNPATFFPWPGETEGSDKGITLRIVTPAVLERIKKQATTGQKREYAKNGNPVFVPQIKQDIYDQLFWENMIVGWSGLEDDDGTEIPCSTENRIKLMTEHPSFPLIVMRNYEELERSYQNNEAAAVKNL